MKIERKESEIDERKRTRRAKKYQKMPFKISIY